MFNQTTAQKFHKAVSQARKASQLAADNITDYSISWYRTMRVYLHDNGNAGYAIKPNGELVSVFNNSSTKGLGSQIVKHAIGNGATHLDCFDGFLVELYSKHGFTEVDREPNWTAGEPDVVWMELS